MAKGKIKAHGSTPASRKRMRGVEKGNFPAMHSTKTSSPTKVIKMPNAGARGKYPQGFTFGCI